jgi:hypothetical protein
VQRTYQRTPQSYRRQGEVHQVRSSHISLSLFLYTCVHVLPNGISYLYLYHSPHLRQTAKLVQAIRAGLHDSELDEILRQSVPPTPRKQPSEQPVPRHLSTHTPMRSLLSVVIRCACTNCHLCGSHAHRNGKRGGRCLRALLLLSEVYPSFFFFFFFHFLYLYLYYICAVSVLVAASSLPFL